MYTRCPKCSTCFRVTDRHLAIANGKVRCGQCQHVFNARQHAIDEPQQAATAVSTPVTRQAKAEVKTETRATVEAGSKENILTAKKVSPAPSITEATPTQEPVEVKPQQNQNKPAEQDKTIGITTEFNSDETMISDLSALKTEDITEIDLDTPSETIQEEFIEEDDDDIFDDSFEDELFDNEELNAAIEELTQANNLAAGKNTVIPAADLKPSHPETNSENIFSTDAYDATSASSVADIFNEMEGQLSLDIDVTESDKKNDFEDEFDFFIEEEEATDVKAQTPESEEKSVEEQFIDELDLTGNVTTESEIDPDELFDEIDLSDFEDDDVTGTLPDEDLSNGDDSHFAHSENNTVPFQLRNDLEKLQAPVRHKLHPLLMIFVILLLLCVSFAQLAFFRAHEVVKIIPASRPLLEVFCGKVHCVYSGPRDIKKIKLLNRDVRQHPKEKNALLITATMINQANFAQPYPDIHIRLSDISGNVVAERIFSAKTYMGKLSNPFLLMKAKTPVHLNFEVVDPGKDAVNFEFTFQ